MKKWKPTDDQLLCRDIQHSWSPYTAAKMSNDRGRHIAFLRTLRCDRCGSFKEQVLSRDGYIVGTTMKYPQGYLRPGEGRLTRNDRAELRIRNIS